MDALRSELENIIIHVFDMKYEYYVMMLMSTYGTNYQVGLKKNRQLVEIGKPPNTQHRWEESYFSSVW